MQWVNLAMALLLPLLLGAACVSLLIRPATPGRLPLVWGNGMLLGLFLTPLVMRLQDALGMPLRFALTASLLAPLLFLVLVHWRRGTLSNGLASPAPANPSLTTAEKYLFALFALLIAARVASLGLELLWRPLFPWDATMHWASKSRVWFDALAMVPFVENQQWLEMGGEGVFTDHHPAYPATIPLLQVWVNGALGRWDESLMNLPWWQVLVGLGAAFYGQARAAGGRPVACIAFTYLLLSMPLLNTHVALAGYADLFLGAAYCAALMALHNWSLTGDRGQVSMALIFALSCPLIKNEGFFWLLTFLPALVVLLLSARRALLILATGLVLIGLALWLTPRELVLAGHSLDGLRLHFRPEAGSSIALSIWLQDNWHMLGYLLPGLLLLCLVSDRDGLAHIRGIGAAALAAISLFLILFMFTRYAQRTGSFTAVGRISLHLAPGLMFLSFLLWNQLSKRFPFGLQSAPALNSRADS